VLLITRWLGIDEKIGNVAIARERRGMGFGKIGNGCGEARPLEQGGSWVR
jgi:hypothetical protein